MSSIDASVDAYGRYADASALADYVELLALQDVALSRGELADVIDDNGWVVRTTELYSAPAIGSVESSDLEEVDAAEGVEEDDVRARRVFELLELRASELGDQYPFSVGARVTRSEGLEIARSRPYIGLLAITVAHAYAVEGIPSPRIAFEDVVADALATRGLRAANLGAAARGAGSFEDALAAVSSRVRLELSIAGVGLRTTAQEEGVDTLGHLDWGDQRPGHWCFIGQATCAKSERWQAKMTEPAPGMFRLIFGSLIEPLRFLAVPHHVEPHQFYTLTQYPGLVLDRLRLARYRSDMAADERAIVDGVLAAGVTAP